MKTIRVQIKEIHVSTREIEVSDEQYQKIIKENKISQEMYDDAANAEEVSLEYSGLLLNEIDMVDVWVEIDSESIFCEIEEDGDE